MTNDERRELIAAVREALGPFKEELKTELKAELKTELKDEILDPMEARLHGEMGEMETRLRGEMGEMETRLRDDFGGRLGSLENEVGHMREDFGGRLGSLENEVGHMREDFGGRLGSLENEVGHMRDDFGGKLDNLTIETNSIINDVVAPFIEMADVRHQELVERLDRLEGQVQSNHKAIENVSTAASLLGRQLMDISDDISIVRKRLDKLERGLNNVTYDLTEARFMVNEEHSIYKVVRELEERVARLEEGKEKSEEAPSQDSGVGELKTLPQIIEWLQSEGAKGKS